MDFEYDRDEFLSRSIICDRLIPELKIIFGTSSYYNSLMTEDEFLNLLTLKEDYYLDFNVRYILDHHTSQHAKDCYYDVSAKIKYTLGNLIYDCKSYSFNYHDFP